MNDLIFAKESVIRIEDQAVSLSSNMIEVYLLQINEIKDYLRSEQLSGIEQRVFIIRLSQLCKEFTSHGFYKFI